ncbi:formimidoylglutamase [Sporosarcina sp. P21c]|uniref:formimidoylglutamase n=1 Tax=Sporosarcina TaxID=1569 RepID=UPI000A16244A|nr:MULTISPECIES: formimidoylglutamase [Sporosarcina]ARJ39217.1 formimidoylglutamase [Sporosarcina ureae]PIC66068.1 formimidoylglutamase [Sporosarcina sp. P16a]PIC82512.1 formimidoylglutamase [Sporosarcina sp. P1]PIC88383.1 formimidoylglutamase [Sporosarcina sp. P21c]PIC91670.1 formimidoylglutamase [Sporosarcina sp. P25]
MLIQSNEKYWSGRTDSETDRAAFRMHQIIQFPESMENYTDKTCTLIGFSCEEGVRRNNGRLGAAEGPNALRSELAKLPWRLPADCQLIDLGTIVCKDGQLELAQAELGAAVQNSLQNHAAPVILGGGHETAFGHYTGVRNFLGPNARIGVINIDAHFDLRSYEDQPSSGTMFKQMLDSDPNVDYLVLGIQEFGNTEALFAEADAKNVTYVTEQEITTSPLDDTLQKVQLFIEKQDAILLTLCSDVLNSAFAPGVSAPSPFGLDPLIVRSFIQTVASHKKTLSFDISEINPSLDHHNQTVKLGAYLTNEAIFALLGGRIT